MNLFRSKEVVQNWSEYKQDTDDGILMLDVAAKLLSSPRHRDRLDPQYISRAPEAMPIFLAHLADLMGSSPYWSPKPS